MAHDEIDNGLLFVQKHHFVVDLTSKEVRDERVYRRCEQLLFLCPRVREARVVDYGTD